MQTQRDHVHAHTFMMGRIGSALVEGDPTGAELPGRRAQTGLLVGVVLALLVTAGFGVYGWLVPGGSRAWATPGAILVEKETGTRYVYLDGVLHPTANLTSAMLIQGGRNTVKLISAASLAGLPRGPQVGIPDAPQTVPDPDRLRAGPWLACLAGSVTDEAGDRLGVVLDPRAPATPVAPGTFALARDGDRVYLLTGGRKHRVDDPAVLVALGAATVRPVPAPAVWLGWLPDGVALAPAALPGAGSAGPRVAGRSYPVGTLFRQADQIFVLRADGLAALSATEFLLLTATTGKPVEVDAAAIVAADRSADRTLMDRLPDLTGLRPADAPGTVLCLRQRPAGDGVLAQEVVVTPRGTPGATGGVHAEPGTGMSVYAAPVIGHDPREPWYVDDTGTAYPLAGTDAVPALGLDRAVAVPFPRGLLALLPHGPALSPSAARG
ncbi:type VII secretion protein EccB [Catenuloplanes japonicus]|uniref:type VII secretion protein EccB n=1 Tax=Catenuloplanes japonicus TaxID=33876 RepID=UPI0005275C27|nr:type VII secretion protein EccB [Catenuloplanes japonicus]